MNNWKRGGGDVSQPCHINPPPPFLSHYTYGMENRVLTSAYFNPMCRRGSWYFDPPHEKYSSLVNEKWRGGGLIYYGRYNFTPPFLLIFFKKRILFGLKLCNPFLVNKQNNGFTPRQFHKNSKVQVYFGDMIFWPLSICWN